jgi:hypothetical protein
MSKGHGRVERAVLELLEVNKSMGAPALAVMVYRTDAELQAGEWFASNAERAAVRRALANLQKQGSVVKLGHMLRGERCSYADRENALAIIRNGVKAFGNEFLSDRPKLARLYTDSLFDTQQVPSPSPS